MDDQVYKQGYELLSKQKNTTYTLLVLKTHYRIEVSFDVDDQEFKVIR